MIELVVTIGILGIVASLGAYSFQELQESFKKSETRYQLDADLRRARNEAVAAGARAVLVIDSGGESYRVGIDYPPYSGTGAPDRVVFSRNLPRLVTLAANQQIIFNSRGYVINLSGDLSTIAVTLALSGNTYFSRTLYPTGVLS